MNKRNRIPGSALMLSTPVFSQRNATSKAAINNAASSSTVNYREEANSVVSSNSSSSGANLSTSRITRG